MSILLALIFVALVGHRQPRQPWPVLVSALTLSFTVTNWMVGILTSAFTLPRPKALRTTVYAFALVCFLFSVQKTFMPHSRFFPGMNQEQKFILHPDTGGIGHVTRAFVFHSVIMPSITAMDSDVNAAGTVLSVQHSGIASAGAWGAVASCIWPVVLAIGAFALFRPGKHTRFRMVLALSLAGQFLLHLLYGEETFLYSLHFVPLLILVAARGLQTKLRPLVIVMVTALALCLAMNNFEKLSEARRILQNLGEAIRQITTSTAYI